MKVLICVLMLFLGISAFFPTFFPCWLFMRLMGVVMGILSLGLGLFHNMNKFKNVFKRISSKFFCVIAGIGLILFFLPGVISGVRDIGPYLSKEYVKITGIPHSITSMGRKWREQTIEINQIELNNTHDIAWQERDKKLEIMFLPRSKYVISIKVIE
ncbi:MULTISPECIES: hypothetical protein [unclassified Paenibacillus]|uniref:hypothetical protein n=1 Tax=unclassified Paenibacillus TaxID=185978 RepID=UPI0004672BB8|nr:MULTISPECIES: hypothetical protein [unclassified Paenibacillus]KGP80186.1 hypothetical protein P364_0120475 [Paenibacillus sp. MAEPY2]KGP86369.1 hypothetical protein P363_0117325 [Paenibacillus sp. MAEPY1]